MCHPWYRIRRGVVPCTYCTQVTQPSSSSRPPPSASDNLFSSGDHDYLGGNRTEACAKDSSRPFLPLLIQFSGDPSSCVPTLLPYFPFCRGGGGAKRQEMAIKILSDYAVGRGRGRRRKGPLSFFFAARSLYCTVRGMRRKDTMKRFFSCMYSGKIAAIVSRVETSPEGEKGT